MPHCWERNSSDTSEFRIGIPHWRYADALFGRCRAEVLFAGESLTRAYRCESEEMLANAVIARVNGVLWDLDKPLVDDSEVELVGLNDPLGSCRYRLLLRITPSDCRAEGVLEVVGVRYGRSYRGRLPWRRLLQ